jgi:hypothetical protein
MAARGKQRGEVKRRKQRGREEEKQDYSDQSTGAVAAYQHSYSIQRQSEEGSLLCTHMVVYLSVLYRVLGQVFGQEIFHAYEMSIKVRVRVSVSI